MKELNSMTTSFPLSCEKGDNLAELLDLMRLSKKNFFPVIDEERCLAGTITHQDICKVLAERNVEARKLLVADAMNYHAQAIYVHEDDAAAFYLMRHNQVNYLPVIDIENHLKGIISFFDIARRIVQFKHKFINKNPHRGQISNFKNDTQFAFN